MAPGHVRLGAHCITAILVVIFKLAILAGSITRIHKTTNLPLWGTGVHLHNKFALDDRMWENKDGGEMARILSRVRAKLQK